MGGQNIKNQIISIKAMAMLVIEKCSELEKGLDLSATGPPSRKGKPVVDPALTAKIIARRQERIAQKISK